MNYDTLYEKVKTLHDEISRTGIEPDMIDFACMLKGWNTLNYRVPNETMRLVYNNAEYVVTRVK